MLGWSNEKTGWKKGRNAGIQEEELEKKYGSKE